MNSQECAVPRRADLNRQSVGERAIQDAVWAVETMGADPRLTAVVVTLAEAKKALADYVDAEQAAT